MLLPMPSLPIVSGAQAVKASEKSGFKFIRQKGSHIIMRRGQAVCVVPNHRELKLGTLTGILKQAGVGTEEFISNV